MKKISFKIHQALKATFAKLSLACPQGILIYGMNTDTQEQFCKRIDLFRNAKHLLRCTRIEICGLGHYYEVERKFVAWIKNNIRIPTKVDFCNLLDAGQWLRYNIASNLYCLRLGIGHVEYYLILRQEWLQEFRKNAFRNK